jgi:hypothetical protein
MALSSIASASSFFSLAFSSTSVLSRLASDTSQAAVVRENRQWKPAVAYCRYADDFVVIVKGTKAQAEEIRLAFHL